MWNLTENLQVWIPLILAFIIRLKVSILSYLTKQLFQVIKCRPTWNVAFKLFPKMSYFKTRWKDWNFPQFFVEPPLKSPDFNWNSHTAPHFESFFWIPVRKSVFFICVSSWLQRCRKTFQNPWLWSVGLVWLLTGTMCPQTATKPELQKNGKRTFITSKLLSLPYC